MELRRVKIDDIKIPEVRVTARFTDEIYAQFLGSLKQTGQITPIIVYDTKDGLVLCDGLHRLIESRENGDSEIYAAILPGDEADVLTKNIMLDHLRGKTPVSEMIQVINYLWKELDIDSEKIAEKSGLTRDYVEKLQRISELTPFCLEVLDQERIGVGHAFALTRISDPVRQETVCNQLLMYHWTIGETEKYIKELEAMVAEQPVEVPSQEPRPTPTVQCSFCRQHYELGQIANPNVCTSCAGVLYATIAEAERQFREEQAAKDE